MQGVLHISIPPQATEPSGSSKRFTSGFAVSIPIPAGIRDRLAIDEDVHVGVDVIGAELLRSGLQTGRDGPFHGVRWRRPEFGCGSRRRGGSGRGGGRRRGGRRSRR